MKIGDTVKIIHSMSFVGRSGKIIQINETQDMPYQVKLSDSEKLPALWFKESEISIEV